jgi:copper(I)-binding protein
MRRLFALLIAVAASTAMLAALAAAPPAPAIGNAWARATPPGTPVGAVYLVIDNAGGKADRLLSVSTDRAERSEVHTIVHDGELMKMRRVDPLHLGAGERVVFEPGGTHVMLMGLKSPLVEGENLALVLHFEVAGTRHVEARVVAATAAEPQSGHQHP